jgi:hypothetical protein
MDGNDKIETRSKERMVSLYTDHDMVYNFLINVLTSIYVSTNIMLIKNLLGVSSNKHRGKPPVPCCD